MKWIRKTGKKRTLQLLVSLLQCTNLWWGSMAGKVKKSVGFKVNINVWSRRYNVIFETDCGEKSSVLLYNNLLIKPFRDIVWFMGL